MPNKLAAKKSLRKSLKHQSANLLVKKNIKTALKEFKKAAAGDDDKLKRETLRKVYVVLDKAAKKGVIHPNKAGRKKSRLTLSLNKKSAKA